MTTVLAMPNDQAKAEAIVVAMVLSDLEIWNQSDNHNPPQGRVTLRLTGVYPAKIIEK